MVDTQFYEYVSQLLQESGHMVTSEPIYANHSAVEALYIDSNKDVAINRFDRTLLMQISNVSRLVEIAWQGVVDDLTESVHIYSITLNAPDNNRSQIVAEIHHLLCQYWDCHHSVVFFKNWNQYVVSFADKDQSHILSDWFEINCDYDNLTEIIDIAGFSMKSSNDYFGDFIYAVARPYYIYPISVEDATYGMMPPNLVASSFGVKSDIPKEEIKALARANLLTYELQYGDDYVAPVYIGYDVQAQFSKMAAELDKISFELELAGELDDEESPIIFDDDTPDDEFEDDDFYDDYEDEFDADIFDDPILMVKWLERKQKQIDEDSDESKHALSNCKQQESERREQERLEAERRERERLEAERREQERLEAERRERERLEAERRERERLEAERRERERLDAERREQERLEAERRERERLEAERREWERLEAERRERERLEAERRERERLDAERRERERLDAEGRERERLDAERREQERLEAERHERERLEAERREQECLKAERREQERLEAERRERIKSVHNKAIEGIQSRYSVTIDQVYQELCSVDEHLSKIEQRIATLSFIQFIEKKKLKEEQESLLFRRNLLEKRYTDVYTRYNNEVKEENQRYEMLIES